MKKILPIVFLFLSQFLYGINTPLSKEQTGAKSNQTLSKTVFGFLPDWQYLAGSQNYIRYDLLTHLAVSPFQADSIGALKDPSGWPWNNVINSAKSKNVKLMMTITSFTPSEIHKILNDVNVRKTLINNILAKFISGTFAGVIIDFENISNSDKQIPLKNFLDSIKSTLNNINTINELAIAVPNINDGNWDFNLLLISADYLFVMCYDYNGSWSNNTGPSSPLTGNGGYNVTSTFDSYFSSIVISNPDKLILGVPYYGNYWRLNSQDPFAQVLPYDTLRSKNNWIKPALRYNQIVPAYIQKGKLWNNTTQTSWISWKDTTCNQIWYDDSSSLALKYDLALSKNLKGIGIWALGYDDGRTELWNLIAKKFSKTSAIEDEKNLTQEFALYQNYPNPFNPGTEIKYRISADSYVTLKVYDLLGREVATLVDEYKPAGIYNSQFSILNLPAGRQGSQLATGVYIYILRAGSYLQSMKMILLK